MSVEKYKVGSRRLLFILLMITYQRNNNHSNIFRNISIELEVALMYVSQENILKFSIDCLTKSGINDEDASLVSKTMMIADLRGIHSHGFIRLPIYIERIKQGLINKDGKVETIKENNSLTLMDANFVPGQVAATRAMETSIQKAKETGIGVTVVKNSNHFGIAAFYAEMAAEENMVGIAISNVEPLMPAIGGAEKVIGNNPIAISAPNSLGQNPIILDMALSNAAQGKIIAASKKGETIPIGWGVDKDGVDTQDPNEVLSGGLMLPFGGPKGFGLALLTEVLTGVISGGQFSKNIPSLYGLDQKQSISYFMLAIDISFFLGTDEYEPRIDTLSSYIKDSKKAPGVKELFLPGEIEFQRQRENEEKGVPIDESVMNELRNMAVKLEVEFSL